MIVDKRFQNSVLLMLRGLIGKRLISYKCDPFRFSNMVYKKIGFQIEAAPDDMIAMAGDAVYGDIVK